jgi:trimethylamine:corrinoid methyltransferase-like protein
VAKLTPQKRAALPSRAFGLPEKARTPEARKETGNYPMPDKGHAISAKRLARKNKKAGNLTEDEFERIERKADKVIAADED